MAASGGGSGSGLRQLTPLLVWGVVFADIGTSVYYVPGILHAQVGDHAPLFVAVVLVGFLFLAAKYVEICWRHPEGGGVVSVAGQAFSPTWGVVGGLMICVDYFLTAAISSVSGVQYLASVFAPLEGRVVLISAVVLLFLAAVNIIGLRESAMLSLVMATAALAVDLVIVGEIAWRADLEDWRAIFARLRAAGPLDTRTLLVGFGSAWLAFSGLEAISQLSPAMRQPIRTTAARGMALLVGTIVLTTPFLTLFSVCLLAPEIQAADHEHFISALALAEGGRQMEVLVVITAASLLFFAANTALVGCYHVFLALAGQNYLPSQIAARNRRFRTPHLAIAVAIGVPIAVVAWTGGNLVALGDLYAFGLLGAFTLSSLGVDRIRWRERRRGPMFWLGVATSALVLLAWLVNLRTKPDATTFGGALVVFGLVLALGTRSRWFTNVLYQLPPIARRLGGRIAASEQKLETLESLDIVTLGQAQAVRQLYPSRTLLALRGPNETLVGEAIARERGRGGATLYAVYVEERTGLFVGGPSQEPNRECREAMSQAARTAEQEGFALIPVWTVSYDAVEGIVRAALALQVDAVVVGPSQRGAIYRLLRGRVVDGLARRLPGGVRLILCG